MGFDAAFMNTPVRGHDSEPREFPKHAYKKVNLAPGYVSKVVNNADEEARAQADGFMTSVEEIHALLNSAA